MQYYFSPQESFGSGVSERPISLVSILLILAFTLSVVPSGNAPAPPDKVLAPPSISVSEIGARAGAEYKGDGLSITAVPGGAKLRAAFQKLEGKLQGDGLLLKSMEDDRASLRVIASEVGRAQAMTRSLDRRGSVEVGDQVARFVREGVVEEYFVGVDGVRQDFVIETKPDGAGDLRLSLDVEGAVASPVAEDSVRLDVDGSGRELRYSRLHVEDANGRPLSARFEVKPTRIAILIDDREAVYPVRVDPTFSDADWVSMGNSSKGAGSILAIAVSDEGGLYVGGEFTNFFGVSANRIIRWNGSAWSALGSGVDGVVRAIATSGSDVYVGGEFTNAGGASASRIAKWNGVSWSALTSGLSDGVVKALAASGNDVYAGGTFTIAGGAPASRIAKWNGSAWSALGSGMTSSFIPASVNALAVSGNQLYAGGEFSHAGGVSANRIAKWDGASWTALGLGVINPVNALTVSGADLYVGGEFSTAGGNNASNIAKWDGVSWSALGPGLNDDVYTIAVAGGIVYAGGSFTAAGSLPVKRIAQWDGASWSAVGAGFDSTVRVMAVAVNDVYIGSSLTSVVFPPPTIVVPARFDKWDGAVFSMVGTLPPLSFNNTVNAVAVLDDVVYAAGEFTTASGAFANHIAKWDGSHWSTLGVGVAGPVYSMVVAGGNLYVGGSFSTAGGVTTNNIARWDGSAWFSLGPGVDSTVYAIAPVGTDLYVGGSFHLINNGTAVARGVAKWNGNTWSALGSGILSPTSGNAAIYALAAIGNRLFAAGTYGVGRGGPHLGVLLEWNGAVWTEITRTPGSIVYALAASGNDLFVGGSFPSLGSVVANRVVRRNGSVWSPLGSGVNGTVRSLAVWGSDLYVAGEFTVAGGAPATHIAKWSGSSWSPLGSGLNDVARALTVSNGTLYAGGDFTVAGGDESGFVASAVLGDPLPVVTGITLLSALQGATVSATISGSSLEGATQVVFSGDGVTATIGAGATATTLPVTITVAPSALPGLRTLTVITGAGSSAPLGGFTVTTTTPTITGVEPKNIVPGRTASGTITGFALANAVAINVSGSGVTATIGAGGDPSSLPVIFAVAPGAASGDRVVTVVTTAGVSVPFSGLYVTPAFSDSTWVSMGGVPGYSPGPITEAVTDNTGNVYVGGEMMAIGAKAFYGVGKWDGSNVQTLGEPPNGPVMAMAVSGNNLYIGGSFTQVGGVVVNGVARWDGVSWSGMGGGLTGSGSIRALAVSDGAVFAAGNFAEIGGVSANNIAKWDGNAWSALGTGTSGTITALAVSGGDVFVGGNFTQAGGQAANRVARWNGVAWSPLGSGIGTGVSLAVNTLAVSNGTLYMGGSFSLVGGVAAANIARWDGAVWSAVGTGTNGVVRAIVPSGDDLYVGGGFTQAGGLFANGVARWDGASWSSVGTQMPGTGVQAMAVSGNNVHAAGSFGIATWSTGPWASPPGPVTGIGENVIAITALGNDVYVVGEFNEFSGSIANFVARWDGSSWSPLGSGLNHFAFDITVAGGAVYAGGNFTVAGGIPASRVAKWNGSAWSALGAGLNGVVNALAASGNILYAGGSFSAAGGLPASNIARWDGSAWSTLGAGTNGTVGGLAVVNGDLYASGPFTEAGGISVNGIAKWDGTSWSPVGQGFPFAGSSATFDDLAASHDYLYASGRYANGRADVARWDGMNWEVLGSDETGNFGAFVLGLAVRGDDVYAGGWFSSVDGVPASGVARWDGAVWSPLGSGLRGIVGEPFSDLQFVNTVEVFGNSLYVGGQFAVAGDKISYSVARAILPPVIEGIVPASGLTGSTFLAAIHGSALAGATEVVFSEAGVHAQVASGGSDSELPVTITVDGNAVIGTRSFTVTTPAGVSHSFSGFSVVPPQTPILAGVQPSIALLGTTVTATLTGANFVAGATTIVSLPGVSVSGVVVTSPTSLTATFAIDPGATPGARAVTITTPGGTSGAAFFNVVAPFPDLTVSSVHVSDFGVGFKESYLIVVSNVGAAASGSFSVADILPAGLIFDSASGDGWSCFASGQNVTCVHATGLASGATSSLSVTVAVGAAAVPSVTHSVSVTTAGDLVTSNNSFNDPTIVVATPVPSLVFSPVTLNGGQQATLRLILATPFPHDVTGTMTLVFTSNAAIPTDDPAIQFATGGRQTSFTIPANTLEARFSGLAQAGPIGFQTGTVAGVLAFSGVLQAGTVQANFPSNSGGIGLTVPPQPPAIHALQTSVPNAQTVVAQVTLSSTMREVTSVTLRFNTTPSVQLTCGATPGCSASGNAVTLDVKALFDQWFESDQVFGSLSVLRLPLAIQGTVRGTVTITLRNTRGDSNSMSFSLP